MGFLLLANGTRHSKDNIALRNGKFANGKPPRSAACLP